MLSIVGLALIVVLLFGGMFFWALVIQPRDEAVAAKLLGVSAWKASGMEALATQSFALYQVVPMQNPMSARFCIQDEAGRVLGHYTATGGRSGTLEYGDKRAQLYLQSDGFGGTIHAGKVGGTSNRSIVIRNDKQVLAEAWRERVLPALRYRFVYAGEAFEVAAGSMSTTSEGRISRGPARVGAFRRPSGSARNFFVACHKELSDELVVALSSILLLR